MYAARSSQLHFGQYSIITVGFIRAIYKNRPILNEKNHHHTPIRKRVDDDSSEILIEI
jgi:hypothetical protein